MPTAAAVQASLSPGMRWLVLAAVGLLLGGLAIWLTWPGPSAQVDRAMQRLKAAVEDGDASGVLAVVAPDYNFTQHVGGHLGDMGGKNDPAPGSPANNGRAQAQRLLSAAFFFWRDQPRLLTYTVVSAHAHGDGRVEAVLNINVTNSNGAELAPIKPLNQWRVVFVNTGWLWPRLKIIDNDPLSF